jgi:hypothetical protein
MCWILNIIQLEIEAIDILTSICKGSDLIIVCREIFITNEACHMNRTYVRIHTIFIRITMNMV